MPLYLVFVMAAGFLVGDWHNALRALSFQFVGFELFPYGLVWWTLTTELQFYLLLPFGWIAYKTGGFPRLVLLVILVAWAGAYLLCSSPMSLLSGASPTGLQNLYLAAAGFFDRSVLRGYLLQARGMATFFLEMCICHPCWQFFYFCY